MQKRHLYVICVLGYLTSVCYLSCDVSEPERYIRPPVIKTFSPTDQVVEALVGDTLGFSISAVDPNDRALHYYFTLADSVVSTSTPWSYLIEDTGRVDVAGYASNGRLQSAIRWHVKRIKPVNLPPVIQSFTPPDPQPTTVVGTPVDFVVMAMDPEGKPLSYIYTVDDSAVGGSRKYTYDPVRVGNVTVKAIVTDGESFVSHVWELRVLPEPDLVPPAPVTLVALDKGLEPGELVVEWIAVGDDGMEGLPSQYWVRTSSNPITDEISWQQGSERRGEPAPATPGTHQIMVIKDLKPANFVYVAVRAEDDFGNISDIGNNLAAYSKGMEVTGTVRDGLTNQPLAGIIVRLAGNEALTAADGSFALTELPQELDSWQVRDEDVSGSYGSYFDIVTSTYEIVHDDVVNFWLLPNPPLVSTVYGSFLALFKVMTDTSSLSRKNVLKTWDPPVDLYVPPKVVGGVDYQQTIKDIVLEWEGLLGRSIFRFVDAEPAVGVDVQYKDDTARDHYQFITVDANGMTIRGRIVFRTVWDSSSIDAFKVVIRHEVGHALGMYHSADIAHIMVGGPAAVVEFPSQDEIWLGQAMYNLPRGIDLDQYRFE